MNIREHGNYILVFVVGFVLGVTGALFFDRPMDKLKGYVSKSRDEKIEDKRDDAQSEDEDEPDYKEYMKDYSEKLHNNGYVSYNNPTKSDNETENCRPYVICPDEFGEMYDYETITLTLYSDGTLADESDEVVEDIEEIVGCESLNRFGEYEADCVFVRNDEKKCDYEILLDHRKYSEVSGNIPL
jgi:hypothetical protein